MCPSNMKGHTPKEELAAVAEVHAVYADLAARPIERACDLQTDCCKFKLTGAMPYLTTGEALVAAKAWRALGRRQLPKRSDGACPMLDPATSRCLIYLSRPFGCRTHFCAAAGGPYARREVVDLIHRLEEVDRKLGGEGGRQLPVAVGEAVHRIK